MEELILKVEERDGSSKGSLNRLRKAGIIPAVVYPDKGKSRSLQVNYADLNKLMHGHHIENAVLKLDIVKKDGKESKPVPVMIKEIQYHPVSDKIIHIDFCQISLTKVIKVKVPVSARGEAIGVKQDGGTLDHVMWEVELECLPTSIPENIEADVTNLKIGDAILVKDLKVASDIKILSDLNAPVLTVLPPAKETAASTEELAGGAAPQEPEVIKEKKPKTEEEAQAQAPKEKEEKK
ncbi:MAG: 50S ribosomal protein L25 [Candidatus Omnitrophota bacterium]